MIKPSIAICSKTKIIVLSVKNDLRTREKAIKQYQKHFVI